MDFGIICLIIVISYIWFETSAFIEYAELFKLKFLKYKEYKEFKVAFPPYDYIGFLLMKYDNFVTKLVTCPICLIVWLNIIAGILIGFNNFGPNVLFSWLGYFGIQKFVKWTNE